MSLRSSGFAETIDEIVVFVKGRIRQRIRPSQRARPQQWLPKGPALGYGTSWAALPMVGSRFGDGFAPSAVSPL